MAGRPGFIALVAASALAVFLAREAWAGPPTDQLRGHVERVLQVLEDPGLKKDGRERERAAAVRRIAGEAFDLQEIAKRSLGRHWRARTPAEREEFVRLFTDLLERAYLSKLELYADEKVAFVGESVDGDSATVRTRVIGKQGTAIPVDYRMVRQGDGWRAYDVMIEGVSLVANYRSQFDTVIRKSSFGELVRLMKAKENETRADAKRTQQTP